MRMGFETIVKGVKPLKLILIYYSSPVVVKIINYKNLKYFLDGAHRIIFEYPKRYYTIGIQKIVRTRIPGCKYCA
jgi:hypothetical protein